MDKNFNTLAEKLLCPPGSGVFTVNTAKERKNLLQKKIYGNENVETSWKKSLSTNQSNVCILGIPSDCGGGILRGANWGPLFVRNELIELNDYPYLDLGDVRVIPHLLHDKYLNQVTINKCRKSLYNEENDLPVSPLSITEKLCETFHKEFPNKKLFSIGGDHSVSYPLVKEFLKAKKTQGKRVGLIHFDAHTDLLKERLGIDICFGSWTANILDYLTDPKDCIQIGIRSSGKDRGHWENVFNLQQYWNYEVKEHGPDNISQKIISYLNSNSIDELYISFDIDALDEEFASATGTPEEEGLAPHECIQIIESLALKFKITGADLVEVAPFIKDMNNSRPRSQEITLSSAALIANSILNCMEN